MAQMPDIRITTHSVWEYKKIFLEKYRILTDVLLYDLGQDGWELCCILPLIADAEYPVVFKRQIIEVRAS